MKINKALIQIILFSTLFTSCTKDDEPVVSPVVLPSPSERVLVSCEGNWGSVDASISSYDTESKTVSMAVFENINGYNPGDVLQSITSHLSKLYLVMNGSASIEVADETSLVAESPINGTSSPRMLLPVSDSKAYVSNIYSNHVQIIDLTSKVVTGSIDIGGWSEAMVRIGDEVFVARNSGSKLMVIDATTDLVIDSVEVGDGPFDMVKDANGDLWVLGFGFDASFNVVDAHLSHVDRETRTVLSSVEVPQPWFYKMSLKINAAGNQLYVMNNEIYTMGITESSMNSEPFIDNALSNYGLGVDPNNGDIYVGYAPDFSSEGTVFRYSSNGTAIDEFQVGIAPNGFYFGE